MTDVYVIGGSLPALAAALEFAEVGLQVRVALDDSEHDAEVEVAAANEHSVDKRGARDHDGALAAFLEHVSAPLVAGNASDAGSAPMSIAPHAVQLRNAKGGWTTQPTPAVLGIPAVPMDAQSLAILGGSGATRAALDRIKPVLTIGKVHEIGTLVRSRLGKVALERLVDPFVRDRFGASPDEVEVATAAPGLNEAVTRAGSLSGAALALADRDVARETRVAPRDGWGHLRDAIVGRLRLFGAEITAHLPGDARPTEAGWRVGEAEGQYVDARVIVADPETRVPEAVAAACALVAPEAWRAFASVEIEPLAGIDPTSDALRVVSLPNGEIWSVRFQSGDGQRWWAHLAGPRVVRSVQPHDDGARHAVAVATAGDALVQAEAAARGAIALEFRPAPHVTLERRDVETTAREALREAEPSLVLVGSSLFAGDLAEGIADARAVSVVVRRRLTGIAE